MKKILSIFLTSAVLFGLTVSLPSCDPVDPDDNLLDQALGWFGIGGENGDDLGSIEDDINFGQGEAPSSIDLSAQFPPIGDQGQYGTCVAWAVGYNHKSYMDAKSENRYTYSESEKFSPKYLFWKIDDLKKGEDCNGTGFEPAYDVLLSSGIANLQTTPYTSLGDCSGSTSSWDGAAANNKILSYREVDIDVGTLKTYLSQGRALTFGAKLGDNFMAWSAGDDVLYDDTYNYAGQHAYHAMILCGYDDNKGSNGAFKVVNSWGTSWGNGGYIWIDYNFFVSSNFCFCAFAATNDADPDPDGNGSDDDPVSGTDLTAWEFELETNISGDPLTYAAYYNVYNTGTSTINASEDWNILLLYYNAYDAEDYDIILYDYYTDDYGTSPYPNNNGDLDVIDPGTGDGVSNWWNYVNVQSGHGVAYDLYYPDAEPTERFRWQYDMYNLQITGDYYLVIIADGYDDIDEVDEDNNYFFFTDINGEPIHFDNGVIKDNIPIYTKKDKRSVITPNLGEESTNASAVNENNLNTYSRDEIISMLKYHRETGEIERKAMEYMMLNKGKNYKKSRTTY